MNICPYGFNFLKGFRSFAAVPNATRKPEDGLMEDALMLDWTRFLVFENFGIRYKTCICLSVIHAQERRFTRTATGRECSIKRACRAHDVVECSRCLTPGHQRLIKMCFAQCEHLSHLLVPFPVYQLLVLKTFGGRCGGNQFVANLIFVVAVLGWAGFCSFLM